MNYRYIKSKDYNQSWKDKNKHVWRCSNRNHTNKIFGEIKRKNRLKTNDLLIDDEYRLSVEPCQRKIGFFEKVIGYVECHDENGNHGLIRIIGRSTFKRLLTLLILLMVIGAAIWGLSEMIKPADDTPIRIASGEMTNPNPENIRLPGIERIYADAGDTHVTQQLLNVEGNAYNLQYTIELEETGEVLYKSKVIEPGYGVREFELNRAFEKGQYPILITVNSSAQEDDHATTDTAYNAGQIEAVLVVE